MTEVRDDTEEERGSMILYCANLIESHIESEEEFEA
eukprot:CAMPEP_0177536010 /NCGR_PEP_ID=MMETSP0369-20130122/56912_1 /TAXON_ID=447022 ORGANISM="Scrippsiella hangoei-like, Strain SHHI-4" /NCGR_SAMPLE_ID=MMETSP0369 /ASSEMBLY_ACC=CAM_ASM_000364 /LENGTH=35 /DNA_ID= /DNA_START= /DNA_END= /DNA_ORIENTATION=